MAYGGEPAADDGLEDELAAGASMRGKGHGETELTHLDPVDAEEEGADDVHTATPVPNQRRSTSSRASTPTTRDPRGRSGR